MFDPTAFENMKVVIEGALYDRDLDGEISIIDRNDVVNMAKLSRAYEVTFIVTQKEAVRCTIRLTAGLENLAAELLPASSSQQLSGSHIFISFKMAHDNNSEIDEWIDKELRSIWGKERSYQQLVSFDPFKGSDIVQKEVTIEFNRLIYEEQIDDIVSMTEFMILSLEKLHIISYRA